MSERKLKPSSSRRWSAASTRLAGSTTIVVSRCCTTRSAKPGTSSNAIRRAPASLRRHAPDLVRGWHARLHGLVQADDPLDELRGARWAARAVHVDGTELVDRLHDGVVVEHAARRGAGAHRDHPLRLDHLV